MQCLLHVLNQSSLQFAQKILQGQAMDMDTSQKAVDKFRLENQVFPFCSTLSVTSCCCFLFMFSHKYATVRQSINTVQCKLY